MIYLDASIVVAIFTAEAETVRLQKWIDGKSGETIAVSPWVDVEFAAVLSAKGRAGALDEPSRKKSLQLYRQARRDSFHRLEIGDPQFEHAERLAQNPVAGLRGGDALHLAVAAAYRATLCTLDRRQAGAASTLGIGFELV
ncbi:MAG TPA: type II toxin-antitoxin system VapC family toxin [Allosphingosinicella sp.]|nr:type II toxin-antitoxin system VapC family toxin [Allosphingosinicella sp.]